MALLCLAVLGKDNEPLYLCDVSGNSVGDEESSNEEDIFGFAPTAQPQNDSLSLRQEFMFHAAIDRLEEIAGRRPGQRWRNPTSPGADSSWIGVLCPMEETRIYGYITTTNVKFLGMVEDSPDGVKYAREVELKALFSKIHDLYVHYTLNPFTKIREKIVSKQFDEGVIACVEKFNEKPDPPEE